MIPFPRPKGAAAVRADAAEIVRRLLETNATLHSIAREYRASDMTICAVYSAHTTHAQREAARVRKLAASPGARVNQFKRGNPAWNSGMKGLHLSPATEFKKGCLRGNAARRYRAIGTVVERVDNRGVRSRYIKVGDFGPTQKRWIPYAWHVWQQANGKPVPPGHRVMHRDLDPMNDDPSNLICLSGAEAVAWQRANVPGMNANRAKAMRRASFKKRRAANRSVQATVRRLTRPLELDGVRFVQGDEEEKALRRREAMEAEEAA